MVLLSKRRLKRFSKKSLEASSPAPWTGRDQDRIPLAVVLKAKPECIQMQSECPLFVTIPAEIRDLIWLFAFIRYEDFRHPYDLSKRYARPGQAAQSRIAVELLRTCQAVYIETFLLPFVLNPMRIFDGDHLDDPPETTLKATPASFGLPLKLRTWQFAAISKLDLTVQQCMLEGGALERASRLMGVVKRHEGLRFQGFSVVGYPNFGKSLQGRNPSGFELISFLEDLTNCRAITHLTLRLNRTDFWSWTDSPSQGIQDPACKLRLEPLINHTKLGDNAQAMNLGYLARKEGRLPEFGLDDFEKQGRWGKHIEEFFPDLRTLELVMETFAMKRPQLDEVVECAKLWKFPVQQGYQLEWNGQLENESWSGARLYGYEPQATWAIERSTEPPMPRTWLQRVKSNKKSTLDSQKFVVKTLVYERRKVPLSDSE